ncbi:MAG: MutS-related protein [Bacilli bacterium]
MNSYQDRLLLDKIGFNYFINHLELSSCYALKYSTNLNSFQDKKALEIEFDNIELMIKLLKNNEKAFKKIANTLSKFNNLDPILNHYEDKELTYIDIFEIKAFTYYSLELSHNIDQITTLSEVIKIMDLINLFSYLDLDNSKTPYFYIYNQYDEQLKHLRDEKKTNDDEAINIAIKQKEQAICQEIKYFIGNYVEAIKANIKLITYLDMLIAKAKMALHTKQTRPIIASTIVLKQAYNLLFKDILSKQKQSLTKIDLALTKPINILMGSNMSGKSLALKTLAFNVACFNYGFYCMADYASMMLVDYLIVLDDDQDDLKSGLSRFGQEITLINQSLDVINKQNGLLIIDEVARGTNPYEAKIILESLALYLNQTKQTTLISTHLNVTLDFDYNLYQVNGLSSLDNQILINHHNLDYYMDHNIKLVKSNTPCCNDAHKVMKLMDFNQEVLSIIENKIEKEKDNGKD